MSSNSCRRHGLTLLEVIFGILLLSTLLVGLLIAQSQFLRQTALARLKLEACEAADQLLSDWMSADGHLPSDETGDIEGNSGLVWRTVTKTNAGDLDTLGLHVVRLTIGRSDAMDTEDSLVYLEIVIGNDQAVIDETQAESASIR